MAIYFSFIFPLSLSSGSVIANAQILVLNVQEEERRKECENVNKITQQIKTIGSLDILTVISKNLGRYVIANSIHYY